MVGGSAVNEEEQLSDHTPKHLLETSLLGRVKHGMQRVRDIAAQHDDAAAAGPNDALDHSNDEEHVT